MVCILVSKMESHYSLVEGGRASVGKVLVALHTRVPCQSHLRVETQPNLGDTLTLSG